jgi:hypothetical protein
VLEFFEVRCGKSKSDPSSLKGQDVFSLPFSLLATLESHSGHHMLISELSLVSRNPHTELMLSQLKNNVSLC